MKGNDVCCDCLAPDPEWASINLGTVICVHCSSVHRQLGTHISRIKSLELDEWTILQLSLVSSIGNNLARSVWEATSELNGYAPPDYACCTRKVRETWIRLKYEERAFLRNVYKDTNLLREKLISSVERGDLQDVYSLLPYCTPEVLNYQDPTNKQTVLHTSVIADSSLIALLLVWNHIDSQLEDTHGKRAIEYAHSPLCDVLAHLTSACPIHPIKSFVAV
ncbi:hypothetical protein LOD99_13195 [Oopsacas minuta]|uniref:Arf-GAP domain-containing protein n=1 Tax=Oopsacas minuta TaxID=111878 RepID=A0AAV7JB65_9METZ|nr:hypothetical protein LOD99_13195 [Oopsacas minuta]